MASCAEEKVAVTLSNNSERADCPDTAAVAAGDYFDRLQALAQEIRADAPSERAWGSILHDLLQQNIDICCSYGAEPLAEMFAREFGRHGPVVDLLLLLGHPMLYPLPYDFNVSEQDALEMGSRGEMAYRRIKTWFAWMNVVARRQVERFCSDPAAFDRYYRVCMWTTLPFGESVPQRRGEDEVPSPPERLSYAQFVVQYERLCAAFPQNATPDKPYYWWQARTFMFLAKATSCDDVLKGARPTELFARFEQWRDRVGPHIPYLVPHPELPVWGIEPDWALRFAWTSQDYTVPSKPFDDWDDAVSLPTPSSHARFRAYIWTSLSEDCAQMYFGHVQEAVK